MGEHGAVARVRWDHVLVGELTMIKALENLPPIEEIAQNSFRDFHAKGLDYLCLKRSPSITMKAYFFEGDASLAPEVINPHDHRYEFFTMCLSGCVANSTWKPDAIGKVFQQFSYLTPLNGGDGFTWERETRLRQASRRSYERRNGYHSARSTIHTITIEKPDTVLLLKQFADVVPVGVPTSTFTRDKEPPSLKGLYREMDHDTVRKRIAQLQAISEAP